LGADNLAVMRVVAVILLVLASGVIALAVWVAIAFGREYGFDITFLGTIVWGVLFALMPLVPGILLLKRSRKRGGQM
jgi:hypothetical protein